LANVFLHYLFDLWVQRWRKTVARGEVAVVRYADDIGLGFSTSATRMCSGANFSDDMINSAWSCIPTKQD
jgi:hypothetical protein